MQLYENSIVQHVTQIKIGIMINVNASVKSVAHAKRIIVGIPVHVFVRIVGIQKIFSNSVILCNEIISATDKVSANVTNFISTNVINTVSINSDDEKVRYEMNCYNLHMLLLVTILLFRIIIIFNHYAKHRLKQKILANQ